MSLYTMVEKDAGGLGASDTKFIRIIWTEYLSDDAKLRKHRADRHKAIRDILTDKHKAEDLFLKYKL